jgi:hypothetical protein
MNTEQLRVEEYKALREEIMLYHHEMHRTWLWAIIPAAAVYTWLALNTAKLPSSFASSTFTVRDFVDLPSLASQLTQATNPVSAYLKGKCSERTRDILTNYQASATNQTPAGTALVVNGLNAIIHGPPLYHEQSFKDVFLRPETKELIAQKPKGNDVIRLNRMLLEDAYPLEISRKPYWQFVFWFIPLLLVIVCFMRYSGFWRAIVILAECEYKFEQYASGDKEDAFPGIARWFNKYSDPIALRWHARVAWAAMLIVSGLLSCGLSVGFTALSISCAFVAPLVLGCYCIVLDRGLKKLRRKNRQVATAESPFVASSCGHRILQWLRSFPFPFAHEEPKTKQRKHKEAAEQTSVETPTSAPNKVPTKPHHNSSASPGSAEKESKQGSRPGNAPSPEVAGSLPERAHP